MPINTSELEFGEEPINGQEYIWRITGVWVKKSLNTGSLYINMNAVVADGPSMGFSARMPMIMLYSPANRDKTKQYVGEARQKLAKLAGIAPKTVLLPQRANDNTETLAGLLNNLFIAKAKWVEAKTGGDGREYEAHFEVGNIIRRVEADEIADDGVDYAAFFEE